MGARIYALLRCVASCVLLIGELLSTNGASDAPRCSAHGSARDGRLPPRAQCRSPSQEQRGLDKQPCRWSENYGQTRPTEAGRLLPPRAAGLHAASARALLTPMDLQPQPPGVRFLPGAPPSWPHLAPVTAKAPADTAPRGSDPIRHPGHTHAVRGRAVPAPARGMVTEGGHGVPRLRGPLSGPSPRTAPHARTGFPQGPWGSALPGALPAWSRAGGPLTLPGCALTTSDSAARGPPEARLGKSHRQRAKEQKLQLTVTDLLAESDRPREPGAGLGAGTAPRDSRPRPGQRWDSDPVHPKQKGPACPSTASRWSGHRPQPAHPASARVPGVRHPPGKSRVRGRTGPGPPGRRDTWSPSLPETLLWVSSHLPHPQGHSFLTPLSLGLSSSPGIRLLSPDTQHGPRQTVHINGRGRVSPPHTVGGHTWKDGKERQCLPRVSSLGSPLSTPEGE